MKIRYKNGCRCPTCGRRGRILHQTTAWRRWEDIAVMGMRVLLWYAPKEIQCPTHGRVQEEVPWAPAHARISYRLEWRICALCQTMTQKTAAAILVLPTSTLSNLLHRVITRVRVGHRIRGVTTLGVDEISFCKGRKFATLVYDLDRARVLWVGRGKGRETIDLLHRVSEHGAEGADYLGQLRHEPHLHRSDPGALPHRDARHRPLPCRESAEPGRGRSPQGTVAGSRRAGPEGDQGAAVAPQHALQPPHQGPHALPQSLAHLQSPHPSGVAAQGRVRAYLDLPLSGRGREVSQTLDDRRATQPDPNLAPVCRHAPRSLREHRGVRGETVDQCRR